VAPPLLVIVALPAVEVLSNSVVPPPPAELPGLLTNIAVAAVEDDPSKLTEPPKPFVAVPPLSVKVALPALEEVPSKNIALELPPVLLAPFTVYRVIVPAVDVFPSKKMKLAFPAISAATKPWATPELLVMPGPWMVRLWLGAIVMLNGLVAAALKIISLTWTLEEIPTAVKLFAKLNVATSPEPFGTVFGAQCVAVFQSDPVSVQEALPAKFVSGTKNKRRLIARVCQTVFIGWIHERYRDPARQSLTIPGSHRQS